jgi:hypothetical protein
MTKEDFAHLLKLTYLDLQKLTESKGEEYSRSDDQLANFKRGAEENDIPQEKVLMVYLSKHMDAIRSWVKNGVELSEPIEGRILDAILFLILLRAMVYEARTEPGHSPFEA